MYVNVFAYYFIGCSRYLEAIYVVVGQKPTDFGSFAKPLGLSFMCIYLHMRIRSLPKWKLRETLGASQSSPKGYFAKPPIGEDPK